MNGRRKFRLVGFFVKIAVLAFRPAPCFFKRFLWELSSPFSGYLALFLRYVILASSTSSCGDNVYVGPNVVLKNSDKLNLGSNISIHAGCYIDASGTIEIGSNVSIAHHTSLVSFNHSWEETSVPIKYNSVSYAPIVIKDDVWIGCAVRIMPGVTIHRRSVIAAGAVVVKDVESNTLVGGVPAKRIKRLIER